MQTSVTTYVIYPTWLRAWRPFGPILATRPRDLDPRDLGPVRGFAYPNRASSTRQAMPRPDKARVLKGTAAPQNAIANYASSALMASRRLRSRLVGRGPLLATLE